MSETITGVELSNVGIQNHTLHGISPTYQQITGRYTNDYLNIGGVYNKINNDLYIKDDDDSYRIRRYNGLYATEDGLALADNSALWFIEIYKSEWDVDGFEYSKAVNNGIDLLSQYGIRSGWLILFRQNLTDETNLGAQNLANVQTDSLGNTFFGLQAGAGNPESDLGQITNWVAYDFNNYLGISIDDPDSDSLLDKVIGTFNTSRNDTGPTVTEIVAQDQGDVFDPNNPVYENMIQYSASATARRISTGGNPGGGYRASNYNHNRPGGIPLKFFEDFDQGPSGGKVTTYVPPLKFSTNAKPIRALSIMEDLIGQCNLNLRANVSNSSTRADINERIPNWAANEFPASSEAGTLVGYPYIECPIPFTIPDKFNIGGNYFGVGQQYNGGQNTNDNLVIRSVPIENEAINLDKGVNHSALNAVDKYGNDWSNTPVRTGPIEPGMVQFRQDTFARNQKLIVFHGSETDGPFSGTLDEDGNRIKPNSRTFFNIPQPATNTNSRFELPAHLDGLKESGYVNKEYKSFSGRTPMDSMEFLITVDPGSIVNMNFAKTYALEHDNVAWVGLPGYDPNNDQIDHIPGGNRPGPNSRDIQWSGFNPSVTAGTYNGRVNGELDSTSIKHIKIPHWLRIGGYNDHHNTNPQKGTNETRPNAFDRDLPYGRYARVNDDGTAPEWRYVKSSAIHSIANWAGSHPAAGAGAAAARDLRIVFVASDTSANGPAGFTGARYELRDFNTTNPYDSDDPRYNADYVVRMWCKAERMHSSHPHLPMIINAPNQGRAGVAQGTPLAFSWNSEAIHDVTGDLTNGDISVASNQYTTTPFNESRFKASGAAFTVSVTGGKVSAISYVSGGNKQYYVGEKITVTAGDANGVTFHISDITQDATTYEGWRGYLLTGDISARTGLDENSNVYYFGLPPFCQSELSKQRNNILNTESRYNYNYQSDEVPSSDQESDALEGTGNVGIQYPTTDYDDYEGQKPGNIQMAIFIDNDDRGDRDRATDKTESVQRRFMGNPTLAVNFAVGNKATGGSRTFTTCSDLLLGWEESSDAYNGGLFDLETLTYKYDLDISFAVYPRNKAGSNLTEYVMRTRVVALDRSYYGARAWDRGQDDADDNPAFWLSRGKYHYMTLPEVWLTDGAYKGSMVNEIVMFDSSNENLVIPDIVFEPNKLIFGGGIVPASANHLGGHCAGRFRRITIKKNNNRIHQYEGDAIEADSLRVISASSLTVNETKPGNAVTFSFTTTSIRDRPGAEFPYTIRALSGNIEPEDFVGAPEFRGVFTLDEFKSDSITLTISDDNKLEGDEIILIKLDDFNVSATCTIKDTSFPATYELTTDPDQPDVEATDTFQLELVDFHNHASFISNLANSSNRIPSVLPSPSPLKFNLFNDELSTLPNINGTYNFKNQTTYVHENGLSKLVYNPDFTEDEHTIYAVDLVDWGRPALAINLEAVLDEKQKPNFRTVSTLVGMCPSGFHLPGFFDETKPIGFDPTSSTENDMYMFPDLQRLESYSALINDSQADADLVSFVPWNYAHWDSIPTVEEILNETKRLPVLPGRRRFERVNDTVYRALPTTTEYHYRHLADDNLIYEALHKLATPKLQARINEINEGIETVEAILQDTASFRSGAFGLRNAILNASGDLDIKNALSTFKITTLYKKEGFSYKENGALVSLFRRIKNLLDSANGASIIQTHGFNSGDALLDLKNNALGSNWAQFFQDVTKYSC